MQLKFKTFSNLQQQQRSILEGLKFFLVVRIPLKVDEKNFLAGVERLKAKILLMQNGIQINRVKYFCVGNGPSFLHNFYLVGCQVHYLRCLNDVVGSVTM